MTENLRYIILECPYDTWTTNPMTAKLFSAVVELKLNGYRDRYPYGFLAVGTTDFIGTHHIVAREINGTFEPLLAYKEVPLPRCQIHALPFPLLSIFEESGMHEHSAVMKTLIDKFAHSNPGLTYYGSWTISPALRGNPGLVGQLKDIMQGVHPLSFRESACKKAVTLANINFHVERMFEFWGYRPLCSGSRELSTFQLPFDLKVNVRAYEFDGKFSALALAKSERYRDLWNRRLIIAAAVEKERKLAA